MALLKLGFDFRTDHHERDEALELRDAVLVDVELAEARQGREPSFGPFPS